MFSAALQPVDIKDRLPGRLAAKTAAPRRRLADCRQSVFDATFDEADIGKLPIFSHNVE